MNEDAPDTIPDLPDIDPADFPSEDDGPLMPHASATYSPEDNKLRIYPAGVRVDSVLDEAEYARFKATGYKWAAKQECFVCPRWTPSAEDWALKLCGEIGDEDYSPEERAADRAERFGGYRDKRATEAGLTADHFEAGPGVYGHQNRARAERQALRHDRYRVRAVSQWSKAEYWQMRTEGVISHALHRSSAPVRRSRIKRLEAEQRKHLADLEQCQARYDAWVKVAAMDGADELLPLNDGKYADESQMSKAQRFAYNVANLSRVSLWHPTATAANDKAREIWRHGFSPYDLMTKSEFIGVPMDRLTPKAVADLYVSKIGNPAECVYTRRWSAHYELRLTYERAMLAAEGGAASDVEMEPGGWIRAGDVKRYREFITVDGWAQIQKVNKSPATGCVVSVVLLGRDRFGYCDPEKQEKIRELIVNVERAGEDVYRPPTDEERAAFIAEKKAKKAPPIPLINPTPAEAQRLQDYLNRKAAEQAQENGKAPGSPSEIVETTQAQFSRFSGPDSVYFVCQHTINGVTFKVREKRRGFYEYRTADCVVVLTDKPQKALPAWDKPTPAPKAEQQTKAAPVAVSDRQPDAGKLLTIEELEAAIS